MEKNDIVTEKKLLKYFDVTKKALDKIKITSPEKTPLNNIANDFLSMAKNYFNDAEYFYKTKKDYVLAFASLNYAHGWLDAGARIGIFDVDHDNKLFTVD